MGLELFLLILLLLLLLLVLLLLLLLLFLLLLLWLMHKSYILIYIYRDYSMGTMGSKYPLLKYRDAAMLLEEIPNC